MKSSIGFMKMLVAVVGIGLSMSASAGSTTNAVITAVTLNTDLGAVVFVNTSVTKSGNPACNTNQVQWVLPLNSSFNNQIYAALLSAFHAKSKVGLYGNGVCNAYAGIETLVQVALED